MEYKNNTVLIWTDMKIYEEHSSPQTEIWKETPAKMKPQSSKAAADSSFKEESNGM